MSNDTPPSPPGPPSGTADHEHDGPQAPATASPATTTESESPPESDEVKARRLYQTTQLKQRSAFLLDLLKRFDTLIYAEIAYLYYLEASLPPLLLRLLIHTTLLSPSTTAPPFPVQKPYNQGLLLANTICILLHAFTALPQPLPGARGYMHGGVWPDFIGQRPPTNRVYLLVLDMVILGAQFCMLAVLEQAKSVRKALGGRKELVEYLARERGEVHTAEDLEAGDLEAAERGEVGRIPALRRGTEEQEPLMAEDGNGEPGPSGRDGAQSQGEEIGGASREAHPLDEYCSGNLMLGTFHVLHTAKEVYDTYDSSVPDQNLMTAGYMGGLYLRRATLAAGRATGV